jgi:hypothetical protein
VSSRRGLRALVAETMIRAKARRGFHSGDSLRFQIGILLGPRPRSLLTSPTLPLLRWLSPLAPEPARSGGAARPTTIITILRLSIIIIFRFFKT